MPGDGEKKQVRPSSLRSVLRRACLRRCPRCGSSDIFVGFFQLRDRCPSCAFRFEREEGYWTGAMIVNIAACEVWFGILFGASVLLTWPDVPWELLLGVALFTNGLLPVVFYPWSKTIWMALEVYLHWDPNDDLA